MTREQIEKELRETLTRGQAEDILGNGIHKAIRGVLERYTGVRLTKRFTDQVTEAIAPLFPTKPVCYYPTSGRLYVWHHPSIPYDKRMLFYIADYPMSEFTKVRSVPTPTVADFEKSDLTYGEAAEARILERGDFLTPGSNRLRELAERIYAAQRAQAELADYSETLPSEVKYQALTLSRRCA